MDVDNIRTDPVGNLCLIFDLLDRLRDDIKPRRIMAELFSEAYFN